MIRSTDPACLQASMRFCVPTVLAAKILGSTVADPRPCGQMNDVGRLELGDDRRAVRRRRGCRNFASSALMRRVLRGLVVDVDDLGPGLTEDQLHEVRPDEPRATRDENAHRQAPPVPIKRRGA